MFRCFYGILGIENLRTRQRGIGRMKHFKDWNIRRKLFMIFTIGCIIPIVFLLVFSIKISSQIMTEKVDQLISENLTQTQDQFNLNLDVFYKVIYQVTVDDTVIQNIGDFDNGGKTAEQAYNEILGRLRQANSGEASVRCISVVTKEGNEVTYDFNTGSSLNTLWSSVSDMRETRAYEKAARQAAIALTPTEIFENDGGEPSYVFHLSKQIYDLDNLDRGPIATAILSIDVDMLEEICGSNADGGTTDVKFIVDDEKKMVYFPDEVQIGEDISRKESIEEFIRDSGVVEGHELAEVHVRDYRTGWYFYYVYNKAYMLKDVRSTGMIIGGVGVLLALISGLILVYMINHIITSVQTVVGGMSELKQGNLDAKVRVDSRDEIGQIAENFNEMSDRIKELIDEKEQTAIRQKNAEIKALEAQIDPHFIYNTLDSINWMAVEHGEFEISRVLRDLGVIMRYSINRSNEKATLAMVEDWLEKYIELQRMRFGYSFTCTIDIDESLKNAYVYKLLLQPFIENSILHGFEGIESGGQLHINVFPEASGERMCIIIEDNGSGMPREKVAEFNNRRKVVENEGGSIGLYNAFSRMDFYYGEKAEWTVSSMEGMGTVISLKLPIEKERENESVDRRR